MSFRPRGKRTTRATQKTNYSLHHHSLPNTDTFLTFAIINMSYFQTQSHESLRKITTTSNVTFNGSCDKSFLRKPKSQKARGMLNVTRGDAEVSYHRGLSSQTCIGAYDIWRENENLFLLVLRKYKNVKFYTFESHYLGTVGFGDGLSLNSYSRHFFMDSTDSRV